MPKTNSDSFQLDLDSINKAAMLLRAFRNGVRQKILALLHKNQSLTVTDIYQKLKIDQPTASMHLAILRKAGIVNTYKDGLFTYYSINYNRIKQVEKISKNLIEVSQIKDLA